MNQNKIYNAGIYLRLSRDDGSGNESESISNQRDFLMKYVTDNGINLIKTYVDDGASGLNFSRVGFSSLIADIETGKINCVITKDLSRLGRDYIMTGYYLERYFPSHNVRYIAVNDNIDTASNTAESDMMPFRAVFNDMYAKDISKKVRTALTMKKLNGKFIGASAPYGYLKDPRNKNKLIIDAATSPNVKRMFLLCLEGFSATSIAALFTKESIPTPSEIKKLTATQTPKNKGKWNDTIIRRILSNPTYAGHLTQNRAMKINYKLNLKATIPPSDWIVIRNTHPAIISDECFQKVQGILKTRAYTKVRRSGL